MKKLWKRLVCWFRGHDWPWGSFKPDEASLRLLLSQKFPCMRCDLLWKDRP